MIVNNFNLIKDFLEFEEGNFYFLQILRRRKDNPDNPDIPNGSNNNYRTIKSYFINSKEYLEQIEDEVIKLCNLFNARAYIGLNKRNYERIAFENLKEISDLIYQKQFHKVYKSYNSCAGYYSHGDKLWIIDIDIKDLSFVEEVKQEINKCDSKYDDNIVTVIPTLNGYHIITRPFNIKQFQPAINSYSHITDIEIHKNNPTLLYYEQPNIR